VHLDLGATVLAGGRCRFRVWAPRARAVEVHLLERPGRLAALEPRSRGYHEAVIDEVPAGSLYVYRLDGALERPDPASRFQPHGVHGPSQVVDPAAFLWGETEWAGLPLDRFVFYELHVGTFTPEGTFDAAISRLDDLKALGITAIELMPVAQFPGNRNWGYDGVFPFAVQNTYGGPLGLKRLINACHERDLAVTLDVVYNHLGPEGNYLGAFAPYFTDRYRTPWGPAVNFDGPGSDEVRHFFLQNALYWVTEFRIDALRTDAIQGIFDFSARPILGELSASVHRRARELGRLIHLFAESDLNDVRVVRPVAECGYGFDGQWNDDFHHALHSLLTGERQGYYQDFGGLSHLVKAHEEGFVLSGQYSDFRRRRHGSSSHLLPGRRLVVFAQNHDQVGNRVLGERLGQLVSFEALKVAAGAVILSPFLPLLFMGEEYGETAPFLYFVSHTDPDIVEAVRRGRAAEPAALTWEGELPDPQDEATFLRSRLNPELRSQEKHQALWALHAELLRLRRELPALADLNKEALQVKGFEEKRVLCLWRGIADEALLAVFNFGKAQASVSIPSPVRSWRKQLDSADERWAGPGSCVPAQLPPADLTIGPESFVVLTE
jgi:maltooligosyltrehalose trehalohydrolase